jgi:hypothetical protein
MDLILAMAAGMVGAGLVVIGYAGVPKLIKMLKTDQTKVEAALKNKVVLAQNALNAHIAAYPAGRIIAPATPVVAAATPEVTI